MAGDGDISYGRRRLLAVIPADGIQPYSMIPPVRTVPVWGWAQSSPAQLEGWTGLDQRLPVLDWTGSVWTGPHTYKFDIVS